MAPDGAESKAVSRDADGSIPVVGSANHLDAVIEEFAVHGIRTDRVIIGGDESLLSGGALGQVRNSCAQRDIVVDFLPNLIGLPPLAAPLRLQLTAPFGNPVITLRPRINR